jgi:AraC-like DNA-binding protein/mannose-6-phosphate isomerase-like protein (cupin superfamily)
MKPRSSFSALYTIEQSTVQLSAGRPVRAQRMDVPEDVPRHDHAYHEICLVTSGRAIHRTKTGRAPLVPGDVFVVPPGEVHAIETVARLEVINAYYLSEWLMEDLGLLWTEPGAVPLFLSTALMKSQIVETVQMRLDAAAFELVAAELAQIEAEGDRDAPSPLFLRCALQKAVATMSRSWIEQEPTAATLAFRPEVWAAIEAIERAGSMGAPYSVAASAEAAGLSVDHFSALFRSSTGYGPMDYFQRRRIHRSCTLLLNPRPSITEIAADLGFSDAPHFCRLFKRYKGMTPSAYRTLYNV